MTQNQTELIDSIAVCVITNDNEYDCKYFLEDLIQKLDGFCTLYIYDYQSKSKDFLNYLANVALSQSGCFKFITEDSKLASIYNRLTEDVQEKYVAFIPINTILDKNWTTELLYHYNNIPDSGCIGIRSQYDELTLGSTLFRNVMKDEDEMRTVWVKKLNVIDAPIFFEKKNAEIVGLINEDLGNVGYELNEFCFRFKLKGFTNYFVRNTTCIKVFVENSFLIPHKTKQGGKEFTTKINQMAKAQKHEN